MTKRKFAACLCVVGAFLNLSAPLVQSSTPERSWGQSESPVVRVVFSDADSIVLDVVTPRPTVGEIQIDGVAGQTDEIFVGVNAANIKNKFIRQVVFFFNTFRKSINFFCSYKFIP